MKLPETSQVHTVVVTTAEGDRSRDFSSESAARRFIEEELLWESTKRVQCESLNVDERGSFA